MVFNFLPWRFKRDRQAQYQFYGLLLAIGLLTGGIQVWVFSKHARLAEHQALALGEQQAQLAEYEAILDNWTAKKARIEESNDKLITARDALAAFEQASQPVGQWLVDVMVARPSGVWIEELHLQPQWVDENGASSQQHRGVAFWQFKIFGHAVQETDQMLYQENLAKRFGYHNKPNRSSFIQETPIADPDHPWETSALNAVDPAGLISFSIEQWIGPEH